MNYSTQESEASDLCYKRRFSPKKLQSTATKNSINTNNDYENICDLQPTLLVIKQKQYYLRWATEDQLIWDLGKVYQQNDLTKEFRINLEFVLFSSLSKTNLTLHTLYKKTLSKYEAYKIQKINGSRTLSSK